jgi:hypothetical protein
MNTLYMCLPASMASRLRQAVDHLARQAVEDLDARLLQLHAHGRTEATDNPAMIAKIRYSVPMSLWLVENIQRVHETLRLVVVIVVGDS